MSRPFLPVMLVFMGVLIAAGCGPSEADKQFASIVPEVTGPPEDAQFDNFPRTAYLQWKPVEGSKRYLVEVELGLVADGTWLPAQPGLNKKFTTENRMHITFPGKQPGRWRVWAINDNNIRSEPSEWAHFEFLR